MCDASLREPNHILNDCVRKLSQVQVSPHFQAILGCLLGEDWTSPRLIEVQITSDGHLIGRCDGQPTFSGTPRHLRRLDPQHPRHRPGRRVGR